MKIKCPICERELEMTVEKYTEKLIKILSQWKGHLTIDQIIKKNEEFLKKAEG